MKRAGETRTTAAARQARFAALLDAHRRIVFKVAGLYARDTEDRLDLAQEIRAQLWRAFPQYDEGRLFSTWMYRIALNVAISYSRSAAWRGQHVGDEPVDPELVADEALPADEPDERIELLRGFIAQQNELDRALLLLYLEEHSYREIADVLGISETNVATKISRLKQRIRQDLAQPQ